MNILALNPPFIPNFVRSARWAAVSRGQVQRHPDYFLTTVALLKNDGHKVIFIDGPAEKKTKADIEKIIQISKPEMIIIHTTTPSIKNDLSYAELAKNIDKNIFTIAIGAHVTACADETFTLAQEEFNNSLDVIALREYDYAIKELANQTKLDTIPGIKFLKNNEIITTKESIFYNVDELLFPAWEEICLDNYRDAGKLFNFLTLIDARGCNNRCSFCLTPQVMSSNGVRIRSVQSIISEIKHDLKLFPNLKEIMFESDHFALNPSHTKNLCQQMIDEKLHTKIKWSCNVRVDIDLELLPLMKKAGCRMLMIGFEFGNQKSLDAVNKNITLNQGRALALAAKKLGLIMHGCFMIGAPHETRESALETINYALSLPLDTVQFSGVAVYPGTSFYKWAQKNNFIAAKRWEDWLDPTGRQCTVLNYPTLLKEEMDELIDYGLKRFYLRPRQIIKMILNIHSLPDLKRKFYGFISFIKTVWQKK